MTERRRRADPCRAQDWLCVIGLRTARIQPLTSTVIVLEGTGDVNKSGQTGRRPRPGTNECRGTQAIRGVAHVTRLIRRSIGSYSEKIRRLSE